MSKSIGFGVLFLLAVALPAAALAQTPWWCNSSFGTWWGTNCSSVTTGQGGVLVYVQVIENAFGQPTPSPADFTVAVSGVQPAPATFSGSITGSPVLLTPGQYSTSVTNSPYGYIPDYSIGCSGEIKAGEHKLCVITMRRGGAYYPYATTYPYPYNYQPLTCSPQNQTVSLGGVGHFEARGGTGGSFSWRTSERSYPNAGPTLNAVFSIAGAQTVTVNSGTQTATCLLNVVAQPGYTYSAPIHSGYTGVYPNITYTAAAVSGAYPKLPNTGFEPADAAAASAFASVLLLAAGIALYPYVRKTLTTVVR